MKRFTLSLTLALSALMIFASFASACDKEGKKEGHKDCPFKGGKAKWLLTELEGEGFLATLVVSGTEEENKTITEKVEGKIAKCSTGECDCKHAGKCPFHNKALTYAVKRTDTGLEVKVTGGTDEDKADFKKVMEAKIARKGHHGCKGDGSCGCKGDKGECKGDCDKKKEGCGCKGECKGGCDKEKKEGCDCKGECKGDCDKKKEGCGCGK